MDSLTQMTLGAAVGEVVLGKKAGNRAMLWGAVAGTIPDLDILAYFFTDDMTALAFHRGITHSITFAVIAPLAFGWLVARFYQSGFYQRKGFKGTMMGLWLSLYALIVFGIGGLSSTTESSGNWILALVGILIGVALTWLLWRRYFQAQQTELPMGWKAWAWLFFWAIITHPLLDSCTTFGTQLFLPFSDYRVGFNNISVVDPIYTLPFLLCVIVAGFMTRTSPKRRWVNYIGIGVSSLYMIFTVFNKFKINDIFTQSLDKEHIAYNRYMTTPTIFNNVLWGGLAEGDTAFYYGQYSFFDEDLPKFKLHVIPKNHHLLEGYESERPVRILKWFSNNYYNVTKNTDGDLVINDLRYGSRDGSFGEEAEFVFKFILKEENGQLVGYESRREREPSKEDLQKHFGRILGNISE